MGKGKLENSVKSFLKLVTLVIAVVLIVRVVSPKNLDEMKKEAYSAFIEFAKENFRNSSEYQGPYLDMSDRDYTVFRWYKLSPDTSVISVHVSSSIWKSNFVSGKDSSWVPPSL
ncbi:hypothetical protein ACFCT7_08910 [Fulvivirgaceae bacterium LMO-SS25]